VQYTSWGSGLVSPGRLQPVPSTAPAAKADREPTRPDGGKIPDSYRKLILDDFTRSGWLRTAQAS
jgi:hypothetical protein